MQMLFGNAYLNWVYSMEYADDYSGYGNEVLYRMCKDAPDHTNEDKIASKIWIIGRAYSAAIERKAGKKMINGVDFTRDCVAPAIRASEIDTWLSNVAEISRVTRENVDLVLQCHHEVTKLFRKITGIEKRSLASKYLHFHQPRAFFIYDSIANTNLRKILRNHKARFSVPKQYDHQYAAFVYRCIYFRDEVREKELGAGVTPRNLDSYLLNYNSKEI
jgi:hypothetical protein